MAVYISPMTKEKGGGGEEGHFCAVFQLNSGEMKELKVFLISLVMLFSFLFPYFFLISPVQTDNYSPRFPFSPRPNPPSTPPTSFPLPSTTPSSHLPPQNKQDLCLLFSNKASFWDQKPFFSPISPSSPLSLPKKSAPAFLCSLSLSLSPLFLFISERKREEKKEDDPS